MNTQASPVTARTALLGGVMLIALGAAACHPVRMGQGRDRGDREVTVAQRLDCPERHSRLRLTSTAPDGRSCQYAGPDGEAVTLSLIALDGRSPQEALAPLEAEFRTLVPAAASPEPGSLAKPAAAGSAGAKADADDATDKDDEALAVADAGAPTPPKPPEPPQVDKSWRAGRGPGEHVRVNLPFLHIDANDNGARVHGLGFDVDADDSGRAVINGAWNGKRAQIHAHDGGVEMRFGAVGEHRADLTYIVASDAPGPQGVQSAAYVAKGPVRGPLVVASARGRDNIRDRHDEGVDDLKDLVNRNVRVASGPR